MKPVPVLTIAVAIFSVSIVSVSGTSQPAQSQKEGARLFERETFGGNGRTCRTCHSSETGTVSPEDAQARFATNAADPLFLHDGSDDGLGHGVSRILRDATILMEIALPANVFIADDPTARTVILRRGIPTTLNTPALDPILMLDGRQPSLQAQATGAIHDHARATIDPTADQLDRIAAFQRTDAFFSSPALALFASGGFAPGLPEGRTPAEKRGRRFFEDVVPNPATKAGFCTVCHSGPLLNMTNRFLPGLGVAVPPGSRFQNVLVSELNHLGNPVRDFVFVDNVGDEHHVPTSDPGRALQTGVFDDVGTFDHVSAFKIPILRGISKTAPYFHDNSAKSLEEVAAHYAQFFAIVTNNFVILTAQDQADMVAFMKLL